MALFRFRVDFTGYASDMRWAEPSAHCSWPHQFHFLKHVSVLSPDAWPDTAMAPDSFESDTEKARIGCQCYRQPIFLVSHANILDAQ